MAVSQSEMRLEERRKKRTMEVLRRHHELLERLRTSGDLTQKDSEEAVECLHGFNEVMKYD